MKIRRVGTSFKNTFGGKIINLHACYIRTSIHSTSIHTYIHIQYIYIHTYLYSQKSTLTNFYLFIYFPKMSLVKFILECSTRKFLLKGQKVTTHLLHNF